MSQKGGIEIIVLILVVLVGFVFAGGTMGLTGSSAPSSNQAVNIVDNPPSSSQNTLQLRALGVVTPIPSQADCPHDNGQQINSGQQYDPNSSCQCTQTVIECRNKKCYKVYKDAGVGPSCNSTYDHWCSLPNLAPTDGIYCLGKPVIYLYPKKDTFVNVSIVTPGKIVDSIPLYPQNGWKDILAHPNGTFEYSGKAYNELYYESWVNNVTAPKEGTVVKTEDFKKALINLTDKLGLIKNEQNELVNYWLPRVNSLNSPYVFVSVVNNSEKQKIDKVEIAPKPDTMIEFLLYFKPEYSPIEIKPLVLPKTPQRLGFTAVEWGGTIDNNY